MAIYLDNIIISSDDSREMSEIANYTQFPGNSSYPGIDLSEYLRGIGDISHNEADVVVSNASIELIHSGDLAEYFTDKNYVKQIGAVRMNVNGCKRTVFKGIGYDFSMQDINISFTLKDRIAELLEKKVGSNDNPVRSDMQYCDTNSTILSYLYGLHNPADVVWALLVYYAEFDSSTDIGNRHVNYSSWVEWRAACETMGFSIGVILDGGQSVKDVIESIADMTGSSIYTDRIGRLTFKRYVPTGSNPTAIYAFDSTNMLEIQLSMDMQDISNYIEVWYNYSKENDNWVGSAIKNNTASQQLYGTCNNVIQDTSVFHYTATSAESHAQKLIDKYANPRMRVAFTTTLLGTQLDLGNVISVTYSLYGLSAKVLRVEKIQENLSKGTVQITAIETDIESVWYWTQVYPADGLPSALGWTASNVTGQYLHYATEECDTVTEFYGNTWGHEWGPYTNLYYGLADIVTWLPDHATIATFDTAGKTSISITFLADQQVATGESFSPDIGNGA